MGDSHASTWGGVPGVSELEGGISLRIESTDAGMARGIEVDPGRIPTDNFGRPLASVKGDLRLQLDTPASVTLANTLDKALLNAGDCTVTNIDNTPTLIHRSSDGTIVRTVIQRESGSFYIVRPSWPSLSGRRFPSITDLSTALRLMGLRPVNVAGS